MAFPTTGPSIHHVSLSSHPSYLALLGVSLLLLVLVGVETGGLGDGEQLPPELGRSILSLPIILLTFDGRTKIPWLG